MSEHEVSFTVNGQKTSKTLPARTLLVDALRVNLGLTGTHIGCDTSQCGACTVIMDGAPVKSCTILAVRADGASIETIEGVGTPDRLHAIQRAFIQEHGLQCGFCTSGIVMMAASLLRDNPDPSEDEIRHALHGNICRCTGYVHIVRAVRTAARYLADERAAAAQ